MVFPFFFPHRALVLLGQSHFGAACVRIFDEIFICPLRLHFPSLVKRAGQISGIIAKLDQILTVFRRLRDLLCFFISFCFHVCVILQRQGPDWWFFFAKGVLRFIVFIFYRVVAKQTKPQVRLPEMT